MTATSLCRMQTYSTMLNSQWKIQSELTPRANVSLTPENFLFLTP